MGSNASAVVLFLSSVVLRLSGIRAMTREGDPTRDTLAYSFLRGNGCCSASPVNIRPRSRCHRQLKEHLVLTARATRHGDQRRRWVLILISLN